jgi:hypothetical protein
MPRPREKIDTMGDGDPRDRPGADADDAHERTVEFISDDGISRLPVDRDGKPILPKKPLTTALYHSPPASRAFFDPTNRAKSTDATEELISDLGVARVPVDARRKPPPAPVPRGISLYHSTILSRALAIDLNGFDDDLDASVSLWYTDNNDAGPLFEDRLPTLPEGLPAELRGAFVEIRVVDIDAIAEFVAHPEHEVKPGQSTRYIIPSYLANAYPRRVVTHGEQVAAPQADPAPTRKKR